MCTEHPVPGTKFKDLLQGARRINILHGYYSPHKYIIDNIKNKFNGSVKLIDEFSFNGDFIESQAFAYLAIRSYLKKFITFPSTTGVRKPCLGGSVFRS